MIDGLLTHPLTLLLLGLATHFIKALTQIRIEGDVTTPFGGYRQSGFGGRDNGIHAHDQYTQLKTIWIDLSDDAGEAVA